ncbi:hypothetical protein HP9810_5g33 [Helicobacter pylori 98-10]|nr:hypothetical protein HP9810_5g33 [Helicobacter pylori 98-10]
MTIIGGFSWGLWLSINATDKIFYPIAYFSSRICPYSTTNACTKHSTPRTYKRPNHSTHCTTHSSSNSFPPKSA